MWIVAIRAVALRAGMLELRLLNFVGLVRVTSNTNVPHLCLRQNDFPVLGSFVANFAKLFAKRRMHEGLHQLGLHGLVRVVTRYAVSLSERLPFVRFNQILVVCVVAVETECGGRFGEVKC